MVLYVKVSYKFNFQVTNIKACNNIDTHCINICPQGVALPVHFLADGTFDQLGTEF